MGGVGEDGTSGRRQEDWETGAEAEERKRRHGLETGSGRKEKDGMG